MRSSTPGRDFALWNRVLRRTVARGGHSSKKGFTQIEMVVAISIISLAAAFAIPNIQKWRANVRLSGAARDLANTFQFAKMEAARRSTLCAATFVTNVDGTPLDAVFYEDDGNLQYDVGEPILREVKFSDSVYKTISLDPTQADGDGVSFAGNTMAFNARGLPIDNGGNIISPLFDSVFLRNDHGGTKIITISPAGNIRIN